MSRWKVRKKPPQRSTRAFHRDGSPATWLASCSTVGPGHEARVQAETARDARRKGAQALGVHHSVVNVALVG